MFGLSLAETVLILLVAVVVIGPKELPTVIRAVMRTLAQLKNISSEFRKNFDDLAREAELDAIKEDFLRTPDIIDLEGNLQRTYDINEDKERYRSQATKQKPTAEKKSEP